MSTLNTTWERIVDENGTIYCCWLWNVHNCEHEETFRPLALAAGIMTLFGLIVGSSLTAWVYFDKKPLGTRRFVHIFMIADITIILLAGHMFSLYTDAYHNSPYGLLVLGFCVISLSVAIFFFGFNLLTLESEFTSMGDALVLKYKTAWFGLLILGCLVAVAIAIIFCHYASINSYSAEAAFEVLCYFVAIAYLLYSLVIIRSIRRLFKRMADLATSNQNSMQASGSSAGTVNQFSLAEKQMKLTKLMISMYLCLVFGVMAIFFVIGGARQIFKIYWLSVLIFCIFGIFLPILCTVYAFVASILEYQKLALFKIPNQVTSAISTNGNQTLSVTEF